MDNDSEAGLRTTTTTRRLCGRQRRAGSGSRGRRRRLLRIRGGGVGGGCGARGDVLVAVGPRRVQGGSRFHAVGSRFHGERCGSRGGTTSLLSRRRSRGGVATLLPRGRSRPGGEVPRRRGGPTPPAARLLVGGSRLVLEIPKSAGLELDLLAGSRPPRIGLVFFVSLSNLYFHAYFVEVGIGVVNL